MIRRLLSWLLVPLLPIAAVLLILALQDPPAPPRAVAAVEVLPAPAAPAPAREYTLRVLRADGAPAADASLLLTAPEVLSVPIAADGAAIFALRAAGAIEAMAWAPGHRVQIVGPWDAPPAELRLEAAAAWSGPAVPLPEVTLRVRLVGSDGAALPRALLLAWPVESAVGAPWLAFAGEDGVAECRVADRPMRLEVFAPDRPPRPEWRLAERAWERPGDGFDWPLELAALALAGLAPMQAVTLSRSGVELDLLAAGEDGVARWQALPPGEWSVATEAGGMSLSLRPGANEAVFAPQP